MLVEKTEYLTAGIHIGMKTCTPYMKKFVYKIREDGLAVFNLGLVDERLKIAGEFLSSFDNILIVGRKDAAKKAVAAFTKAVGGKAIKGRFIPGTLTNPSYVKFYEPDVLFVTDPFIDEQAMKEAKKKKIPVVALCDTFNIAKDIDFAIPSNNNGRKSMALVLWVLAREIQLHKGMIKDKKEFAFTPADFGDVKEEPTQQRKPRKGRGGRTGRQKTKRRGGKK